MEQGANKARGPTAGGEMKTADGLQDSETMIMKKMERRAHKYLVLF